MNINSHPWKNHIAHQAETLHQLNGLRRWSESSSIKLEESVLLGCYAIRRLVNAYLLPDTVLHGLIPMIAYPRIRQSSVLRDEDPLHNRYDLNAGKKVTHELLFACHQVLHNCHFEVQFSEDNSPTGILVTSDHQRKVALYGIAINTLETLFRKIAEPPQA
jgi:hypothetical protein